MAFQRSRHGQPQWILIHSRVNIGPCLVSSWPFHTRRRKWLPSVAASFRCISMHVLMWVSLSSATCQFFQRHGRGSQLDHSPRLYRRLREAYSGLQGMACVALESETDPLCERVLPQSRSHGTQSSYFLHDPVATDLRIALEKICAAPGSRWRLTSAADFSQEGPAHAETTVPVDKNLGAWLQSVRSLENLCSARARTAEGTPLFKHA